MLFYAIFDLEKAGWQYGKHIIAILHAENITEARSLVIEEFNNTLSLANHCLLDPLEDEIPGFEIEEFEMAEEGFVLYKDFAK